MRAALLLPVLLLVQGLALPAQSGDSIPADWIPRDPETHWTIAVAGFQAIGLSPDNLYLTHSLPLLLRERLSGIRFRYFTAEERSGYRQWILRQEQRRLGQGLQLLRRERDALFFRGLGPAERSERLATYDRRIEESTARLSALTAMDPALIEFPESKDIRFKEPTAAPSAAGLTADPSLLEAPGLSPLRIARQEQVNLLIWGSLEEIQGYLFLEVRALDAHLGREVYFYSDAAQPAELYDGLAAAATELSRTIRGRESAALAVETTPAGAQVYVDRVYAGRAPLQLDHLSPGWVRLRIEAPGYRGETLLVELAAGTVAREVIVLETRPEEPLYVSSDPEGASVYGDASWLGITPLVLQRPEASGRFLLRLDGHRERVLYLGPGSGDEVAVSFEASRPDPTGRPLLPDPAELQALSRDRFYRAFGFFAASVPLPMFFWAATNDLYTAALLAAADNKLAEVERLQVRVNGHYYSYLATLGLSATLFVNMAIHLVRYVRSADRRG